MCGHTQSSYGVRERVSFTLRAVMWNSTHTVNTYQALKKHRGESDNKNVFPIVQDTSIPRRVYRTMIGTQADLLTPPTHPTHTHTHTDDDVEIPQ